MKLEETKERKMQTVEWFEEVNQVADTNSNPEDILSKFEELEEETLDFEEFITAGQMSLPLE